MNSMSQADNRVIRVFVSSTFRDMQAERDELVKRHGYHASDFHE